MQSLHHAALRQLLMLEITTVLLLVQPLLNTPLFRQLTVISEAVLMMQGRVDDVRHQSLDTSWGSYRTIQRFF